MTEKSRTLQDVTDDIIKGMELSKAAMIKEEIWNEDVTFEMWARYAGSHCIIARKEDEKT